MNKKLLEKSIDLNTSKVHGGMLTYHECTTTTHYQEGCSDTETQTTDDNGNWLETCTDTTCPNN